MLELVLLGLVNYLYILLRALQSRSINYAKYHMIVAVGTMLGMFEVVYITQVASRGSTYGVIAAITISGILASLCAVWLTRKY
jgi:hypothetical protein